MTRDRRAIPPAMHQLISHTLYDVYVWNDDPLVNQYVIGVVSGDMEW